MADKPTPPNPEQQGSGADAPFLKMLAKVGIQLEQINDQEIKKAFTPLQKYMVEFNKTTDIKNTFFGKLPGIKGMLENIKPDIARFTDQLAVLGYVSKHDTSGNHEFYDSLGLLGKGLSNTVGWLKATESEFIELDVVADIASFGITALITVLALAAQGLWNTVTAGIKWQDRLNEFSKTMGGIGKDRLYIFNAAVNTNLKSLQEYGFALGDIISSFDTYIKSGLNPAIATNQNLTKATMQLATVTGESASDMATFFSGIYRGSRLSLGQFEKIGEAFTTFNAAAEKSGKIGVISFGDFKEAINSVGTALLIAASKGDKFTEHLTSDLMGLTSLSKTLNISVSSINSLFEQASNLVNSQESGFRAMLAISGGAGIKQMLTNQFDRTDAMLKVSDKLEQLTARFGGNLNIMGQVAEQAFQIPKDVAIKFAQMTGEQKRAIQQAKQDSEYMKSGGLEKAWTNVSTTISTISDRFRNTIFNMFQRAFAGNAGLQRVLDHIGETLGKYMRELSEPNSGISKIVDKLGEWVGKFFDWTDSVITDIIPKLEKWINDLNTSFKKIAGAGGAGGFLGGLKDVVVSTLKDVVGDIGMYLAKGILKGFLEVIAWPFKKLFHFITDYSDNAIENVSDKTEKLISKQQDVIKNQFEKSLAGFSDLIKSNNMRREDISHFKDTDLLINEKGDFTLAGMERNKLEDEHDKLIKSQTDATKDLTDAIQGLRDDLTGTGKSQWSDAGVRSVVKVAPASTPIADRFLEYMSSPNRSF